MFKCLPFSSTCPLSCRHLFTSLPLTFPLVPNIFSRLLLWLLLRPQHTLMRLQPLPIHSKSFHDHSILSDPKILWGFLLFLLSRAYPDHFILPEISPLIPNTTLAWLSLCDSLTIPSSAPLLFNTEELTFLFTTFDSSHLSSSSATSFVFLLSILTYILRTFKTVFFLSLSCISSYTSSFITDIIPVVIV